MRAFILLACVAAALAAPFGGKYTLSYVGIFMDGITYLQYIS